MLSLTRLSNRTTWLGVALFLFVGALAALVVTPHWQSLTSFFRIGNWSNQRLGDSIGNGNKILWAIEQYRQINGKCPETLEALVPKYLPYIEPPTAGDREWRYQLFNNDKSFILSFATRTGYPKCYYSSDVGMWGEDS